MKYVQTSDDHTVHKDQWIGMKNGTNNGNDGEPKGPICVNALYTLQRDESERNKKGQYVHQTQRKAKGHSIEIMNAPQS